MVAKVGSKVKVIRFGQQGVKGIKKPRTEAQEQKECLLKLDTQKT